VFLQELPDCLQEEVFNIDSLAVGESEKKDFQESQ